MKLSSQINDFDIKHQGDDDDDDDDGEGEGEKIKNE